MELPKKRLNLLPPSASFARFTSSGLSLACPKPNKFMFHEIGNHALNHFQNTVCAFQDYAIYDNAATMENEANMFLAEYLLDTDETMQVLTEQNSFFVTASILEVPPEILDFKWRMLKYYGYLSGQSPISVGSDCLKKMQVGGAGCDEM